MKSLVGFIGEALRGWDAAQELIDSYVHARWAWSPHDARAAGVHMFDGVVLSQHPSQRREIAHAVRDYIRRARALMPTLSSGHALDLRLLELDAQRLLSSFEGSSKKLSAFDIKQLFDVSTYVNRRSVPVPRRTSSLVKHIISASSRVEELLERVDAGSHESIEILEELVDGYKKYYEHDVRAFLRGTDPSSEPIIQRAIDAMGRVSTWLHDRKGTPNKPMGEDALMSLLRRTEGVRTTPYELRALAVDQLNINRGVLMDALARMGSNPRRTLNRILEDTLTAGEVMDVAADQVQELRGFVHEAGVVPMLDHGSIVIAPAEPFKVWATAYVEQPGALEHDDRTFYRVTLPDASWPEEKRRLYLPFEEDLLMTTAHEMFPGHRLQGMHQDAGGHLIRRVTKSSTFSEGWAHYAEQLVVEAGLRDRAPRVMVAYALKAMLRACRLLACLAIHIDGASMDEVAKMFHEKSFVDTMTAIQQAKRGLAEPGYMSYISGKTDILLLRDEFLSRGLGSPFDFHNWLLEKSSVPPALLVEQLHTV